MGFLSKFIGATVIGTAAKKIYDGYKEDKERRNTPCAFEDGISEEDFEDIAYRAKRQLKRVKHITVDGPVVYATVKSNSGISEWNFKVDFNDWGHITGTYWTNSDNSDSQIPHAFGEIMQDEIEARI